MRGAGVRGGGWLNETQRLELLAITQADCRLRERYLDPDTGKTCAVGAFALAAGVSREMLLQAAGTTISPYIERTDLGPAHPQSAARQIREAITQRFGLSKYDLQRIQQANDGCSRRRDRVAAVRRQINAVQVDSEVIE